VLKSKRPIFVDKLNIESLTDESTKQLYQNRVTEKIALNNIETTNNVEVAYNKLVKNIMSAANEAIGTRKVNINSSKGDKSWFTPEVKNLTKTKREAYLCYRSNINPESCQQYKTIRNRVNSEIRQLKREYWEKFTGDMTHDLYGAQKKVWKMLRGLKKPISEYKQLSTINTEQWESYFTSLYSSGTPLHIPQMNNHLNASISLDEVEENIKKLKNRKANGVDRIPNELLKYGGAGVNEQIHILFNKILEEKVVPNSWTTSITVPIYKKGDKTDPKNYRGITLLNSLTKLFTSILKGKIESLIPIREEQQGFRKNRSTLDAIFIVRQIVEKSYEFNHPVFMCFVDLTKAFDRVQLNDVLNILNDHNIPQNIIQIIRLLNENSTTKVRVGQELSNEVPTSDGVRQGDSLSPLLFNLIMDKIIQNIEETGRGYKMGSNEVKCVCYADDAVLISDNEDDLQRQLFNLINTADKYNMVISAEKTKCLTISREPVRCKLIAYNKPIEQVSTFKYLGVTINSYPDLRHEVQDQVHKASVISGCLRSSIWKNKYMNIESKTRIYKTCIRPILTYAAETRADTTVTKRMLRTTEMKILRSITNRTLRDRIRNSVTRDDCQVPDIVRWTRARRRAWRDHVGRMHPDRIAKVAMTGRPRGARPVGRPLKRWKDSWLSTSQQSPSP